VFGDALLWSESESESEPQWRELQYGSFLMPTMGHSMIVAGNPRAVVVFGGLSVDTR
jgi:hypothetical protein